MIKKAQLTIDICFLAATKNKIHMKRQLTILFLICISNSFSQTKQETLSWLNQKLKEYTETFMGEFQVDTKVDQQWGEIIVVSARVENEYMSPHTDIYTVLPKNIQSVVTTTEFRSDGKLGIKLISKSKNIYFNNKEFVESIDVLCIPAPDETIIRMQKAFIHLLNLLGNPISMPKELFHN